MQCVCVLLLEDLCQRQFNTLALRLLLTFFHRNGSSLCRYVTHLQLPPPSRFAPCPSCHTAAAHQSHSAFVNCTAAEKKRRTHTLHHTLQRSFHHAAVTFTNPTRSCTFTLTPTWATTSPVESFFHHRKRDLSVVIVVARPAQTQAG